ncbi:hypothetical protein [Motilibacter deserti]|uniref:Uncharacterized protein n=1 Tax=Motilibacter deserti TaxID=2714956 RepID=A0ABX0GU34_9ACTN|nr:hypothetical protein [Motilibacter deserti]NHC13260.1 hypothetical protein [Motilibacter deserti]
MRNVFPYVQLDVQRSNGRGAASAGQPAGPRPTGKGPAPARHAQGRQGKAAAGWQYRRH